MSNKKALLFAGLIFFSVAFFDFAFFYDFDPEHLKITPQSMQSLKLIFYVAVALSFAPCIILSNSKVNVLLGFIPPFILNAFLWGILIYRFEKMDVLITGQKQDLIKLGAGLSLLSGAFGILIASFVRTAIQRIKEKK